MSCVCLLKLKDLLRALLPVARLNIRVPPVMAQLAAVMSTPSVPPSHLNAALRLGLPALPLNASLLAQIAATATAVAQINAGLGINLLLPGASAQLALTVQSLNLNLGVLLPIAGINTASLLSLSLALSTIASVQASLGINLLAPGAAAQLNAALALRAAAPRISLAAAARLSAYAQLSAAAALLGGPTQMVPTLRALAMLSVPRLRVSLAPLAALLALIPLLPSIRAVLGINPAAAGAGLQIRLALRPLLALPSLNLSASAGAGLPALASTFAADARAVAGLRLGALAGLRLPNLGPLSLVASLALAAPFTSSSPCGSCPLSARF